MHATDEITYGRKKFGFKEWLLIACIALFGLHMFRIGFDAYNHTGAYQVFHQMYAAKCFLVGLLCTALSLFAIIGINRGKRTGTPRLTLYSTGLSYKRTKRLVFEARWDSLGEFQVTYTPSGKIGTIEAPVTGDNVSELVAEGGVLAIYPVLLDVDADALVEELNELRAEALSRRARVAERRRVS